MYIGVRVICKQFLRDYAKAWVYDIRHVIMIGGRVGKPINPLAY